MNKNIFALFHIICIVYANPVKRDGVYFAPVTSDSKAAIELPIMIVKLPDLSSSVSEEDAEIPFEFPFDIAKSIDDIFVFNRNSFKTEKPIDDNSATCPNTDLIMNAEAATKKPTKFKKYDGVGLEVKPKQKNIVKKIEPASEKSESMESLENRKNVMNVPKKIEPESERSESIENIEARKIRSIEKISKLETPKENKFMLDKIMSPNKIPQGSKEKGKFFKESFILKKVDGKPVEGTFIFENVDDDIKKSLTVETDAEMENLETLEQINSEPIGFESRIFDVLNGPFKFVKI